MSKAAATIDAAWPKPAVAWYGVVVLLLAYTFAYVDRAILTVLVEPIQRDLHINDTQIALLHGFAFVIFYVTLGVPLGFVADRTNRKRLIVGSIAVWSLMTAACGLTSTFASLFAARIGVGIGEAGLSPASYSLISDQFPPSRRSSALGVYTLGIYFGSGLAILAGGLVVGLIGVQPTVTAPLIGVVKSWQLVFFVVGLPGLLVAALAATVREPVRRLSPRPNSPAAADLSASSAAWAPRSRDTSPPMASSRSGSRSWACRSTSPCSGPGPTCRAISESPRRTER